LLFRFLAERMPAAERIGEDDVLEPDAADVLHTELRPRLLQQRPPVGSDRGLVGGDLDADRPDAELQAPGARVLLLGHDVPAQLLSHELEHLERPVEVDALRDEQPRTDVHRRPGVDALDHDRGRRIQDATLHLLDDLLARWLGVAVEGLRPGLLLLLLGLHEAVLLWGGERAGIRSRSWG